MNAKHVLTIIGLSVATSFLIWRYEERHKAKVEPKVAVAVAGTAPVSNFVAIGGRWIHTNAIFVSSNPMMQTLTVDTLNVTNVDMVEQALIEELGPEQGGAVYRRVTERVRINREAYSRGYK